MNRRQLLLIHNSSFRHSSFPQQWIWIDVLAVPIMFGIGDEPDGEVEVAVACAGVARVADVSNGFAALDSFIFCETGGVRLQMRVVIDQLVVGAALVDRRAAARALKEFNYRTFGGGDDRRAAR